MEGNFNGFGQGEVIPPERARATHGPLPGGENIKVLITEIFNENPAHPPEASENWEVRVRYPSGLIKGHQVPKGADAAFIIPRIRNQLRGMHGGEKLGELTTTLPAKVEHMQAGFAITFEGDK